METKKYVVLIIDDHPLISNAYKSAFNHVSSQNKTISFDVYVEDNCDSANHKIDYFFTNNVTLDIVFLDIKLPPSKDGKILSGEDLGLKINTLLPKAQIIVATTFDDNFRIHSIFKSLNPEGFLIKNDITPKELVTTINTIITDPPYYSKTVIKLLRKEVSNNFLLDDVDRKLLHELSIGTMMKDLPNVLLLSIAGIEKRKRRLKQIFDAESPYDKELLMQAKDRGFI